ncbi:MAG: heavy metal-binding domain-containing protein [Myxococcales bacterium]|nr:MAG: heavy metal-binding domain-containing protein [Myxococcales bacterium]
MIQAAFVLAIVATIMVSSRLLERYHFRQIRLREETFSHIPISTNCPSGHEVDDSEVALVTGSIVIAADRVSQFQFLLRALFGGHITRYDALFERARREALLRLKEQALELNFERIVNVRLQTALLGDSHRSEQRKVRVEVLAYGTATRRKK